MLVRHGAELSTPMLSEMFPKFSDKPEGTQPGSIGITGRWHPDICLGPDPALKIRLGEFGLQGDIEAKLLQTTDKPAASAVGVELVRVGGTAFEIVRAARNPVKANAQDRMGDSDSGFVSTATAGEAAVLLTQIGVGVGSGMSGLDQGGPQIASVGRDASGVELAAALLLARGKSCPRG